MSRLLKILLLATTLGPACAQAAETNAAPPITNDLYVGVGVFGDMLNFNVEAVTGWGNFMVRVGEFQGVNEGVAGNLSWRTPLDTDNGNISGYYVGLFAGQVVGDTVDGELYQRLGGGGEIGYHRVTNYTRTELTVGLGAAEPVKQGNYELPAEPTIFFSVNVALGY